MSNLGQEIWEKGGAAGREIGVENEKVATIKRLYRKGYSIEIIADASGKAPEEVEAILTGQELQTT